jgi:hypothetical protein
LTTGLLSDPGVVVKFFRDIPPMPLSGVIPRWRPEIIPPIGQASLFHPERVVLPDMCFVGMISRQAHLLKAIERPLKISPEIEVL